MSLRERTTAGRALTSHETAKTRNLISTKHALCKEKKNSLTPPPLKKSVRPWSWKLIWSKAHGSLSPGLTYLHRLVNEILQKRWKVICGAYRKYTVRFNTYRGVVPSRSTITYPRFFEYHLDECCTLSTIRLLTARFCPIQPLRNESLFLQWT